jgi:hypothetical protein
MYRSPRLSASSRSKTSRASCASDDECLRVNSVLCGGSYHLEPAARQSRLCIASSVGSSRSTLPCWPPRDLMSQYCSCDRSKETDANTRLYAALNCPQLHFISRHWAQHSYKAPTFHLPAVVDRPPYRCPWNVAYPPGTGSRQPCLIAMTRRPKQRAAPTSAATPEGSCSMFAITTIAAPTKAATA